jgi:hypothetical protein
MDERERTIRWGMAAQRYYALELSYFMSEVGSHVLGVMSQSSLWIRVLSSSAIMETEVRLCSRSP